VKKHKKVIGFPNEIHWNNGELFKWIADDTCHGLPCQRYPEHWLVRLLDRLDREADQREAAKLVLVLMSDDQLKPATQSQAQISMGMRRHQRRHGQLITWTEHCTDPEIERINNLLWWRTLASIPIDSRVHDPVILHEIKKGEWD